MGSILAEDMRTYFLPGPRGVSRIGIWMKQPVDADESADERRHALAAILRERSEHLIFAFRHPHVHLTLFHLRLRLYAGRQKGQGRYQGRARRIGGMPSKPGLAAWRGGYSLPLA